MFESIGTLLSSNYEETDRFGAASAVNGDGRVMVIGAPYESSNASGINGDQNNNAVRATSSDCSVLLIGRIRGPSCIE